MNPFSNTTNESSATNPKNVAPNLGPGSEVDRYDSHFGVGSGAIDRLKKAVDFKGIGAEQDRYEAHFSIEQEKVKAAASNLLAAKGIGAEQDRHETHFGLGNDGWEKAKKLAAAKGDGAEQARDQIV